MSDKTPVDCNCRKRASLPVSSRIQGDLRSPSRRAAEAAESLMKRRPLNSGPFCELQAVPKADCTVGPGSMGVPKEMYRFTMSWIRSDTTITRFLTSDLRYRD